MTDTLSLAALLSASGDIAYDWDLAADHIDWHGDWSRLFGAAAAPPATSATFYRTIHDDDRHLVFGPEESVIDREYRLRAADGRLIWVHERGMAEFHKDRLVHQRGLLRVIDKQAESALAHEKQGRDSLTNCLERNTMLAQMNKTLETVKAAKRTSAYIVIGIDKMSFVNEAVGMEMGDMILCGVAQRLQEFMPPRALLGRVGGDMFGIFLADSSANDIPMLAERLVQSFREQPLETPTATLHITVSIGGVRMPNVARSAGEAMIFAEQALHAAHQRGRNLFIEYIDSPERMQENRQMLELGERVKKAFKNNGLRLAFQPIVDGQTAAPLLYEALVRMFGDDGKVIPAAEFVPAIEQLGLALDLDRIVLDLAVSELEAYPQLTLAINISGLTAAQAGWPDHIRRVLGHRRPVAERLIVEITETAAIVDVTETRRFVDALREMGGRVALDDFGAGFTSIRHLRSLDLYILKIDRDLLQDLMGNADQQHLVRMLVEIARGLGLKTVAEGVETADVAAWLKGEKVDMLQGYFFGRPSLDRPWLAQKESDAGGAMPKISPPAHGASTKPNTIRVASSV